MDAHLCQGFATFLTACTPRRSLTTTLRFDHHGKHLPTTQGTTGCCSVLNAAVEALNLAKEVSTIAPTEALFGSPSVVFAMIKVGSLLVEIFR